MSRRVTSAGFQRCRHRDARQHDATPIADFGAAVAVGKDWWQGPAVRRAEPQAKEMPLAFGLWPILVIGSVVQDDSIGTQYDGIYTVMDTGPNVQGRMLDLYMWSCREANEFGRQSVLPLCGLDCIDVIVTDSNAPKELVEQFRAKGIEVIVAQLNTNGADR